MSVLGSPAAIEALATNLDRRAGDLVEVGRRLSHQARTTRWACAKAERYKHHMDQRQKEAHQLANELQSIAKDLRRLAARVRSEIEFLGGLERSVREMISSVLPDMRPPWEGTRWSPTNLPRPGDPAWREVAKALGVQKGR